MIAVVTACSREQWPRTRALVSAIRSHWPAATEVFLYHEGQDATAMARSRRLSNMADWLEFSTSHGRDPMACGRAAPHMGWPPKAVREGYWLRTDAVSAARKVFAIRDAARQVGHGILLWVEPDAGAEKVVTQRDIVELMGRHDLVVHNGRAQPNTAIVGFWLPNCLPLIERWAEHYARDEVFRYREWHADATLHWAMERHPRLHVGPLSDHPAKDPWACERAPFQRPVLDLEPA